MSLKSFFDWFKEEEKKRRQEEKASLNTDVNVLKNTPANKQSNTVKSTAQSGAGVGGGTSKVQSNAVKSSAKSAVGGTSKSIRNTDVIDSDWGLNAQTYADMYVKPKKASVNKSTDMIDNDYSFNVKAMDDYLSKMRSGQKSDSNKGAVIYGDVGDKIEDNKYADTMINIGKSYSNFGKYNHLNNLYYIDNPTGVDHGYKYITKNDMNKYYYLLAQHEKGDVDKKDVDDLKHYLFNIGTKIDAKDADELPPIKNKPDYSKISSEEQLIYDSFGNIVNKAKGIDYSDIPNNDQFADTDDDIENKAIEKAKDIDYNKIYDSFGFEVNADYNKDKKILSNIGKDIKESADWAEYGEFPAFTKFPSDSNENNNKSNTNDNNKNNETAASKEISLDNLSAINDVVGTTANLLDFKITGAVSDTIDAGLTLYKIHGLFKTSLSRQEALVSNAYNIGQYYYNLENNLPHENTFVLQPMKNVIVDKDFADSCKRFYENYFAYADYTHFNTNIANLSYDELSDKDKKNIINYSNTHTIIERYKYNELIKPIGDFTVKQLYIMKFNESD